MKREAIILAGGFGTRLRQVLPDLPKPMAPIGGRPFLEILLRSLAAKGFGRIILSLGYKAEVISTYFGSSYAGIDLVYLVEDEALGTGGAVRWAMDHSYTDHVYIFNGDTYVDLEVEELEARWQVCRCPIIVGCNIPDTARYGRLLTSGDQVTGFAEKRAGGKGVINAGCYVFNRGQLDSFPRGTPFSLENDYLTRAVNERHIGFFITRSAFIDIGVPEDLARAQSELVGLGGDFSG